MDNIAEAKKARYLKFYSSDPDYRRLYHIHVASDNANNVLPQTYRENMQLRIDWAVRQYETWMSRFEWVDDDFIPYGNCITGTEIFAEAFGCKVQRPSDNRPFALPLITKSSQIKEIKIPKLEDSSLFYLFDMADKIKEGCGAGALLNMVDPQTPMDIAALIWDKNYFFAAMIDEPEAVKELAQKVSVLFFAFFDEWFKRYGKEFIAHDPDYYMPSGMDVSEDEIGAVSPAMFEEFFLPELVSISGRYGGLGMHSCSNSKHHWDNFKKIPNFKMFNITHPYDNEFIAEAIKYLAGHIGIFPTMPQTWFPKLSADAWVHLDFWVNTEDEIKALSDKLSSMEFRRGKLAD